MMDLQNQIQSDNASTMNPVTNLVAPADPDVTNEPQQVTQWVDDAAVQRASLPNPTVLPDDLILSGTESREHNIHDILARPVKLSDVQWTDAQTADSTAIATFNFPEDLINASPNIADKISHFTFLRAHIVVRFVVNANTFQAGRLVAYFAPFSSATEIGDRTLVNNYMGARTVFPRVVLDAGSGNSGELTIPYVSFYSHYNLAQGMGDMGSVYVVVLNPLKLGNAYVSVFARFTNISLEIPTAVPNQLGTFSSMFAKFKTLLAKGYNPITLMSILNEADGPDDYRDSTRLFLPYSTLPMVEGNAVAQGGEAVSKAEQGVVSGVFQTVAKIAEAASPLPVVGKFLTPVNWIAQAAAQVATYFGLSKPMNLSIPTRFLNLPGYALTNADAVDSSVVLGASCENEIGTRIDVFGSELDEMDIKFVCQHECYLTSFTWGSDQSPGVDLIAVQVTPGVAKSKVVGSATLYDSTALAYVASMFRLWRGSIKFKVQVTKTAYHSGRLRVAYVPGGKLPNTGYDLNQGYSEIVDLRTSDEVTLTIPFVSNTLFKNVALTSIGAEGTLNQSTGILIVEIVNALRHPESVATTLDANIWISGGDDIQFAVPDFTQYMPVVDDASMLAYGIEPWEIGVPRAQCDQSLESWEVGKVAEAQVMGQFLDAGFNSMHVQNNMFDSRKVDSVDASATSIGEHIQNLRQLIRRFGFIYASSLSNNLTGAVTFNTGYFGSIAQSSAPDSAIGICPLDYVSWLYRFYRGGQRYKMLVDKTVSVGTLIAFSDPAISILPSSPSLTPAASSSWLSLFTAGSAFFHQCNLVLNNLLEVTVPYYSNTYISLIRSPTGGTVINGSEDRTTNLYMGADFPAVQGANLSASFLKAGADDFSFGWLVGPPRLMARPAFGTSRTVRFDSGMTLTASEDSVFKYGPVVVTPALSNPDNEVIVYAGATSFNVALNGGGTMSIAFVDCRLVRSGSTTTFEFVVADVSTVDITATLALLQALPTLDVLTRNV